MIVINMDINWEVKEDEFIEWYKKWKEVIV